MRTVTLELLRHGPPHNQLLSPLTPYLALCENHAPVTVHLEFEHHQFLHRLSALSYDLNESQRQFQLRDTGVELGKLLCRIPGLTAELSPAAEQRGGVQHLRLILSASELALLPFELALAGNGFPGDGQPLSLQSQVPLCVTREVRRVREPGLRWGDTEARVLFACASPHGLPAVPLESHLLALRKSVSPWVGHFETDNIEQRREQVDKRLHVLPRATLHDIERECASGSYTHVHILAHGVLAPGRLQARFGLALHDPANPDGPPDIVSGERLASALRPLKQPPRNALNRPHVVTLASCNAGQVASVIGGGASVAHALHEAGIPLVVAGQFPLSFAGSVRLVEVMYNGLLWGIDPRELLIDLRRRLHSMGVENHDWASLVAYAALPDDFDDQIARLRVDAAKRAVDTAMDFADRATHRHTQPSRAARKRRTPAPSSSTGAAAATDRMMLRRAHQKIDIPCARLEGLLQISPPDLRHTILGLLASADKRHAEVKFWTANLEQFEPDQRDEFQRESVQLLGRSRARYWQCFRFRPGISWATVQYIALTLLLRRPRQPTDEPTEEEVPEIATAKLPALWSTARTLSLHDLDAPDERSSWALGNLIELSLISTIENLAPGEGRQPPAERVARGYIEQLMASRLTYPFQIYSTRRQLQRYAEWFPYVNPRFGQAGDLAHRLLDLLHDDGAPPAQRR